MFIFQNQNENEYLCDEYKIMMSTAHENEEFVTTMIGNHNNKQRIRYVQVSRLLIFELLDLKFAMKELLHWKLFISKLILTL